jgi:NADH:ubiquinone oxidoreductase subunit F (NADH-binding)
MTTSALRRERTSLPHGSMGTLGALGTRLLAGPVGRETLADQEQRLGRLPLPYTDTARGELLDVVAASGLLGRGGAEFPLATKLRTALVARGAPIVVVNGSESEPASRKDAVLMRYRPHLVLDGAVMAAAIVGASQVVVYLHSGTGDVSTSMMAAMRERSCLAGQPQITLRTSAAGFVGGESSAVVSALSGGPRLPRRTPVPAAVSGVGGHPTVVSNVETLAHLALLTRFGSAWFRTCGSTGSPGSTLLTLAGGVLAPGIVVEVGLPVSVGAVLAEMGGLATVPAAVLIGGYGGRWLGGDTAWSAPIDRGAFRRAGVGLGCGLVASLPVGSCGLEVTVRLLDFLAGQSAGQCGSCLFGLPRLSTQLRAITDGTATRGEVRRLNEIAQSIVGRGACAHPDGAVALLESALDVFRADVRLHLRGRHCGGGAGGWFPTLGDVPALDDKPLKELS